MQNFKQYLQEKQDDFAPWHIKDSDKIDEIISTASTIDGYKVLKNSSVQITTEVNSFMWNKVYAHKLNLPLNQLPIRFSSAKYFTIEGNELEDIWGAPIKAYYVVLKLNKIKTLSHLTGTYGDSLALYCPNLERFDCNLNVPHIVFYSSPLKFDVKDFITSFPTTKTIRFELSDEDNIFTKIPLLSFYKNKIAIDIYNKSQLTNKFNNIKKLYDLYNNSLHNNIDILEFQDILIENGFKQQARF